MNALYRMAILASIGAAAAAGACTSILGDDFTVTSGTGDGGNGATGMGGNGTGGNGNGGSGGSGGNGTGGGGSPPSYVCDWDAGTIREVQSLAGTPMPTWNRIQAVKGAQRMRLFMERTDGTLSVHSLDDMTHDPYQVAINASLLEAKRATIDKVAAVFLQGSLSSPAKYLRMVVVDDSDQSGMGFTLRDITSPASGFDEWDANFAAVGNGNSSFIGDVVFIYSFLDQSGRAIYHHYWDGSVGFGAPFFGGQFTKDDMRVVDTNYIGGRVVVHMGNKFDGADHTRVFEVVNSYNGSSGALSPTVTIPLDPLDPNMAGDVFLTARPRSTSDYAVIFAQLSGGVTLLGGVATVANLATFGIADATAMASIGNFNDLPQTAEFAYTNDSFILAGLDNNDAALVKLLLLHRTDGIRFQGTLPFPVSTIFPAGGAIVALAPMVDTPSTFDQIGGNIALAFVVDVSGAHRLWYGEIICSAM